MDEISAFLIQYGGMVLFAVVFAEQIGFLPGSRKEERLREAVQYIASMPERKSNFDTLPPEAWDVLRGAAARAGRSLRSLGVSNEAADRYVATAEEAVFYRDPHVCTSCRYRADDMLWRCPHCHEWNTFVEERLGPASGGH